MAQPDAWRREIDVIIETRLLAAGFERFDGISYSFHVNDEVLGVVHIYNQELGYDPANELAVINTRFGMIHYQIAQLLGTLEDDHPLWLWTLGHDYNMSNIGKFIGMFDIHRTQSLASKEKAIEDLVQLLWTTRVPYVRAHFNSLQSVIDYMETKKHQRDEAMLCTALAIAGQTAKAKERADHISATLAAQDVNKRFWPLFKKKFDSWLSQKAPVPSLKEARKNTFRSASERSAMVEKMPLGERPTW